MRAGANLTPKLRKAMRAAIAHAKDHPPTFRACVFSFGRSGYYALPWMEGDDERPYCVFVVRADGTYHPPKSMHDVRCCWTNSKIRE